MDLLKPNFKESGSRRCGINKEAVSSRSLDSKGVEESIVCHLSSVLLMVQRAVKLLGNAPRKGDCRLDPASDGRKGDAANEELVPELCDADHGPSSLKSPLPLRSVSSKLVQQGRFQSAGSQSADADGVVNIGIARVICRPGASPIASQSEITKSVDVVIDNHQMQAQGPLPSPGQYNVPLRPPLESFRELREAERLSTMIQQRHSNEYAAAMELLRSPRGLPVWPGQKLTPRPATAAASLSTSTRIAVGGVSLRPQPPRGVVQPASGTLGECPVIVQRTTPPQESRTRFTTELIRKGGETVVLTGRLEADVKTSGTWKPAM